MYAIIENGGRQYKVQEGDVLFLDRISGEEGKSVIFDKVVAVSKEDGVSFGNPFVKNAKVSGEILGHGKNKKIIVFKFKAKKGYKRKQGHRQPHTRVKIEKIDA
ncbi:50S ribosomal protein L21 [Herbivorax sp. ANBcel31]|uniref:50S ribosomal protein L21 n=1 Tax=Herbivorax sp. ANBcel31 TaxID=3069754 RepID=UPI0027AEAF6A|nr:50S ribosomal protein L21 [Herbivorax sp. ANBcel31]MDQ2087298.1 50S ribosomal protein L21 [Herbivorax sp. ANBcel31]